MSLSYEEALSTLQSMFSDQGYTAQHLDAVLRHQGGHMENTVEALLAHGDGTPNELMRKLSRTPPGSAPAGVGGGGSVDADAELARQLAREDEVHSSRGVGGATRGSQSAATGRTTARRPDPSPAGAGGRGTPTALPPDFLRIPGRKYPPASPPASSSSRTRAAAAGTSDFPIAPASGPGDAGQMMTDEQLARMLQDELFQEELRNNPEFSHLAGRRNPRAHPTWGATGGGAGAGGQATGRSNYGGVAGGGDVGKDILEGLSSECLFETPHSSRLTIFRLQSTTFFSRNLLSQSRFVEKNRRNDARARGYGQTSLSGPGRELE
jgi:hypothetical protein